MLFPQIERYVDLAAIDAFFGRRDRGEHPIVVVLANTYTLDCCSMRNGKRLRCCTTLLFLWLTMHLFHSSKKTRCPIENHYWSCVKLLTKAEWNARLDGATKRSILWYPQWNERDDMIICCGGFLNVPLMGTKGAINCNPELTLRQAGYPMVLPSSEEAVTPFILYGLGIQEGEHLKKIHQAWKRPSERDPSGDYGATELLLATKSIFLTFGNPRIKTGESELESWETPEVERWFRIAAQEKGLRELERNQALLVKEELIAALANIRSKEEDARGHLSQLQE
ncbi:hypothetical protein CR513_16264, partial [Mucuna pruriens]